MRLRRSMATLTLLLTAAVPQISEPQTVGLAPCSPSDVPLKVGEDSKLKVLRHRLSDGIQAQGEIQLRNLSSKPILALSMLVTYRDSAHEILFSIPYYASVQNAPERMDVVHPFLEIRWDHVVEPGEEFALFGSNLLSAREKPATAEAGLIDIRYEDGTQTVVSSGHGSLSDPLLTSLPELFEVNLNPEVLPLDLIVEIQIDSAGRVSAVSRPQNPSLSPQTIEQAKHQIMQWKFFPATRGVYAVPAELCLWLRFHAKRLPLPEAPCPRKLPDSFPRTFAEVDLRPRTSTRWEVIFSGHPAPGSLQQPRILEMHAGPDSPACH